MEEGGRPWEAKNRGFPWGFFTFYTSFSSCFLVVFEEGGREGRGQKPCFFLGISHILYVVFPRKFSHFRPPPPPSLLPGGCRFRHSRPPPPSLFHGGVSISTFCTNFGPRTWGGNSPLTICIGDWPGPGSPGRPSGLAGSHAIRFFFLPTFKNHWFLKLFRSSILVSVVKWPSFYNGFFGSRPPKTIVF